MTSVKGKKTAEYIGTKEDTKNVVLPATITINDINYKVTAIPENGFIKNKKLSKLTIGKNIKKIGKNAFTGCKKLKYITIKTKKLTDKTVGKNAFKGINSKAIIKVPSSKVKEYRTIIKAKGASDNVKITK